MYTTATPVHARLAHAQFVGFSSQCQLSMHVKVFNPKKTYVWTDDCCFCFNTVKCLKNPYSKNVVMQYTPYMPYVPAGQKNPGNLIP